MRVKLTLRSRDGERDIEIRAQSGTTARQLAPLFAALAGDSAVTALASGGRPLPEEALLGGPGLRSGCVITLGASGMRACSAGSALQLRVVGGPDSGQLRALSRGRHLIGRAQGSDLELQDPDVSRRHAELCVDLRGITVRDLDSTNGTWLNGTQVTTEPRPVGLGAALRVGDSLLSVLAAGEPPAAVSADGQGGLLVHRPPHIADPLSRDPVEFPAEQPVLGRPRLQWVAGLAPAVLGVGFALLMRNNQFLAFALLSPLTMLAGAAVDRREWRRSRDQAGKAHARAEAFARERLEARLAAEKARRHRDFIDAAAVLQAATVPDCRLWERRPSGSCFLTVRLGIADQAADTTATRSGRALPAEVIEGMPATVSLLDGPLGLAGPLSLARGSGRWVIGQLLALHSPRDLAVVALLDGEIADWRWLRWAGATVKAVTTEPDGHRLLLRDLLSVIADRRTERAGGNWSGPRIVVLLDRASALAGLDGLQLVLEQGPTVGVTAVCIDQESRLLPPSCHSTAVLTSETGSTLELCQPGRQALRAATDRVSARWAEQLARSLAPLQDADSTDVAELPTEVWLADLLEGADVTAESLSRQWATPTPVATPIGMAATGPVELNLLRDGPHALIAGSTGSGKSELLRSLVTGLARRHAPDDVAFVLIDYKGGSAFAECAAFPHTLGLVTDLDGHLTSRALTSLQAEIRRREIAFAQAGVAEFDDYRRSASHERHRLARLVMVVDEFAYLAEELPDFLSGLIGIAQRGRSLGLHLVLATQRPAGVVSPQIKANVSLRIALRVTDAAESHDVIGSDAAHRISKNQPGRGFAQLADGLVEFQTARVGRRPVGAQAITITSLDAWNRASEPAPVITDADDEHSLLQAAMLEAVSELKRPLPERPWLPPLPSRLRTADLGRDPAAGFGVRFGLVDDPGRQRQFAASHDLLTGGSIGFIGSPRSGRTSALRTILGQACEQLDAAQLHLYVLDCSGQSFGHFARLPHCGAVVSRDDPRAVARLSARLVEELAARQRLLADLGVSTLAEAHLSGTPLPVIVLALDGWEGFTALSDDYDAGRSVEALLRLSRDGAAVGITVLIAGDRAMLGLRIAPALSRKLLLGLIDRGDYASVGLRPSSLPARFGPGRAVSADDGLEVQLALLTADTGPGAQHAAVQQLSGAGADSMTAPGPTIRIRSLPASVRQADLAARQPRGAAEGDHNLGRDAEELTGRPGDCLLGVGGDEASPVWAELFVTHARFLIAGPPLSGRSTTAVVIARQGLAAGLAMLVAAPPRSPLAAWASRQGLDVLAPDSSAPGVDGACAAFTGQLVLIDDAEQFTDTASGAFLTELATSHHAAVIAATRSEELAMSFRGPAAAVRRRRTGLLLQPSPADGELLGVRIGGPPLASMPGRGLLVTDATRASAPDGLAMQVAI
ncbi:MAG TPA: FtsK/SpoIIIE domain-containing protein [Jatrophihabitans sp.]|jgi:S-DNA-T family DNA segregation ATPase FtsK/SpoIIIE|uniref:FtsK/SpoIIIE domain-containing protein n=1 Tax=Jatrophihabitans sp. TaxID=1932789 RepID=UPI002EE4BC84